MDNLALMACYAAGVISLIFALKHPAAGVVTHLFAIPSVMFLAIGFMSLGSRTDAYSLIRWTGEAETGPITALILFLALAAPFLVGWERDFDRRRR